jgi:hypothetical protein
MTFSDKQLEFLKSELERFNILWGTTGSGKSYIANIRFLYELRKAPEGSLLMCSGNTQESLYDNVVRPVIELDNGYALTFKVSNGANYRITCKSNKAQCICVGANNDGAEARIQGKNVAMWYADEIVKQPMSFISMADTRCRYIHRGTFYNGKKIWTMKQFHL